MKIKLKTTSGQVFTVVFTENPLELSMVFSSDSLDPSNKKEVSEQTTQAVNWADNQNNKGFFANLTKFFRNKTVITIKKRTKVLRALRSLDADIYTNKKLKFVDKISVENWGKLNESYKKLFKEKAGKVTPPKKHIDLQRLVEESLKVEEGSHSTKIVTKKPKTNKSPSKARYFFKSTENEIGAIAEIEAALATMYCAYLGKRRAPKARSVFDQNKRVGVALKEIEGGYISFKDFLIEQYAKKFKEDPKDVLTSSQEFKDFVKQQNFKDLVDDGIVELLVASYVFEEADLHWGNWGFDGKEDKEGHKVARIDFDQSNWSLTSKFSGFAADNADEMLDEAPRDAFPITEKDIRNFPILTDAKPNNWIFGDDKELSDKFIADLKKHPDFERRKWTAFLKAILMPKGLIENITEDYIGNQTSAKKYAAHNNARIDKLRMVLLGMPEFRQFIQKQGEQALKNILDDIDKNYNSQIKDSKLQYNTELLKKEFVSIHNVCSKSEKDGLTLSIEQLEKNLKISKKNETTDFVNKIITDLKILANNSFNIANCKAIIETLFEILQKSKITLEQINKLKGKFQEIDIIIIDHLWKDEIVKNIENSKHKIIFANNVYSIKSMMSKLAEKEIDFLHLLNEVICEFDAVGEKAKKVEENFKQLETWANADINLKTAISNLKKDFIINQMSVKLNEIIKNASIREPRPEKLLAFVKNILLVLPEGFNKETLLTDLSKVVSELEVYLLNPSVKQLESLEEATRTISHLNSKIFKEYLEDELNTLIENKLKNKESMDDLKLSKLVQNHVLKFPDQFNTEEYRQLCFKAHINHFNRISAHKVTNTHIPQGDDLIEINNLLRKFINQNQAYQITMVDGHELNLMLMIAAQQKPSYKTTQIKLLTEARMLPYTQKLALLKTAQTINDDLSEAKALYELEQIKAIKPVKDYKDILFKVPSTFNLAKHKKTLIAIRETKNHELTSKACSSVQEYQQASDALAQETECVKESIKVINNIIALNTAVTNKEQEPHVVAPAFETVYKKVVKGARAMVKESDKLAVTLLEQKELKKEDLTLLSETAKETEKATKNPLDGDPDKLIANAQKLKGKAGSKVASVASMVGGALIIVAATVLIVGSVAFAKPSFGVSLFGVPLSYYLYGIGSTFLIGGGIGLFCNRQKATAKAANDVGLAVAEVKAKNESASSNI